MSQYPTSFQKKALWNAATVLSMTVLGCLLVGLIWLLGKVLGFLQPVIVPLAIAGVIAYLLDPLVRLFQERGLTRLKSVIATFALFLVAGIIGLAIAVPMVGKQVNRFRAPHLAAVEAEASEGQIENAPMEKDKFLDKLILRLIDTRSQHTWMQPMIDPLLAPPADQDMDPIERNEAVAEFSKELDLFYRAKTKYDEAGKVLPEKYQLDIKFSETSLWNYFKSWNTALLKWLRGSTSAIVTMIGFALGLIMVPIYLFYFLRDASAIRAHWHDYIPVKASNFKVELVATLSEINGYLIAFFRGQVLLALIDGILIGICLTIFGLPLGLLFGVMMAILGIIPFVGNILTLIPACLLAWLHFSDPANQHWLGSNPVMYVAGVALIFFLVQQINSFFTAPKIVGDSVGLHPMTVIFSMLFWSLLLGGFTGAILAVPLTAALKVIFRRYVWENRIYPSTPA